MVDNSEKQQILSDILQSPEFRDSKRYQDLLQYLVKETLANKVPKEITVAIHFFGKDSSFDPKEDPTVRVYINNLRKKLDHYYLTCEKPLLYKLDIPKGHYEVEFIPIVSKPSTPLKKNYAWIYAVGVTGLNIIVLVSFFLFNGSGQPKSSPVNPIWTDFVQPNGRPTLVVLGDFYFLFERSEDGKSKNIVRNFAINSPDDYKEVVRNNPAFAQRYVQSDFTFLRPSASWGLAAILPTLQASPNGYSLKLASQFTIDDAKANNIIYIGSFKNLYNFQKILHIFHIHYNLTPASFHLDAPDSSSFLSPSNSTLKAGNVEADYAVVAKAQGPEGSIIMLMLGFADTGVIEATRFATDAELVGKYITKDNAPDNRFFTAVVETEGLNQSILKTHVRYLTTAARTLKYPITDSASGSQPR
jgi:hypothetical protein